MNEFVKTGEVRVVKNQNKWEIRCNYTKSSKSSSSKRKTAYGYSSQLEANSETQIFRLAVEINGAKNWQSIHHRNSSHINEKFIIYKDLLAMNQLELVYSFLFYFKYVFIFIIMDEEKIILSSPPLDIENFNIHFLQGWMAISDEVGENWKGIGRVVMSKRAQT